MATVTSLTADRIMELAAGWSSVASEQESTEAFVQQLNTFLEQNKAALAELNEIQLPQLTAILNANDASLSDVTDNLIPTLGAALAANEAQLNDLHTVTIPSLSQDLASTITNVNDRPNVYVQDTEPTNPDADDRYLVVGDSWFDPSNNNLQKLWNGVEWSTFKIDIPDLSITAVKFKSSTHMLY